MRVLHTQVGICGRTGAGKSSVLRALYRLTEPAGGSLLIDSIDVRNVPLHRLRTSVSTNAHSALSALIDETGAANAQHLRQLAAIAYLRRTSASIHKDVST
jgi:ABC-type multidrug transport system fused ATPase/permease subunit